MKGIWTLAAIFVASITAWAQVDTSSIELFETLDEVNIERDPGVSLSKKSILTQELVTEVELRKAACCDLSESFETNASISASFTDAVTGTRQIKLLGLEGPYALYTRGNLQTMGGLSSVLGLALIPGAWIQSIQLTKGPGSVVNGASGISGQINYELRPSHIKQIGHVNLFAGPGRFEQNVIYSWAQKKNWSSNLMLHGRQQLFRWDMNNDGYLDAPLSQHYFIQNAWKFSGAASEGQLGVKASTIKNIGGSTLFGYPTLVPIWSHELQTDRYELWAKRGYFLDRGINRSIGTQFAAEYQNLDSYFGNLIFTGEQKHAYGNLIFQDNLVDTRHTLKTGMNFDYMDIRQKIWDTNGDYSLLTTGMYGEYSYVASPDGQGLSFILGQRLDHIEGDAAHPWQYVPRVHVKYNHGPWGLRGQFSRSYRYATLGAEYMGYMANSRIFQFSSNMLDTQGYIKPLLEQSWTRGLSLSYTGDLFYKELQVYADYYRTSFPSKLVLDLDQDENLAQFYLLEGGNNGYAPSSTSIQLGGQYELIHRTLFKVAYRYQDVQQVDIGQTPAEDYIPLEQAILNVPHLVYAGMSYSGRKGLGVEINATYNSPQRLPDVGYTSTSSPAFTMLNAQLSYTSNHNGQFYTGLQNLLNVRQSDPVIGGNLPFDNRFDASVVWGPIMGRQLYARWRYDLKAKS